MTHSFIESIFDESSEDYVSFLIYHSEQYHPMFSVKISFCPIENIIILRERENYLIEGRKNLKA